MQISICIQSEVDKHATSFHKAPIHDSTDGRVWLLVNYDDCLWDYDIVKDYIDGEEGGVSFSEPFEILADCKGFFDGYRILNAEDCISDHLGFL